MIFSRLSRHPIVSSAVLPATLALAAGAQLLLDQPGDELLGAGLLAFAAAATGFALLFNGGHVERPDAEAAGASRIRVRPLIFSAVMAAAAFALFAGNRYTPLNLGLWIAAGVFALVSIWDVAKPTSLFSGETWRAIGRDWTLWMLALAMLGGSILRLWAIDTIPAEMGTDLPLIYQGVARIFDGNPEIFSTIFPGREGLFFYVAALATIPFGLSDVGLLATSAIVGTVTIPALYLLGRELFNREVGLYASALIAVSHWHVILSRAGLRAILVPLILALAAYFLLRGLRTGRHTDWILAGILLGLGLQSYNAFPAAIPAVAVFLLLYAVGHRGFLAARRRHVGIMIYGCAIGVLPLARYILEAPESYIFRIATRVTDAELPLPADLIGTFANNLRRSALMFNDAGDAVANIAHHRQLEYVTAILFVLGLGYLILRYRRGRNLWVLTSLVVMLLPSALSLAFALEVPSGTRAVGVMPAVFVAAGLAAYLVRVGVAGGIRRLLPESGTGRSPPTSAPSLGRRALVPVASAMIVVAVASDGFETAGLYFEEYRNRLPRQNYSITRTMADVILEFGDRGPAAIVYVPHFFDGHALQAQLEIKSGRRDFEGPPIVGEASRELPELFVSVEGEVLFILAPGDGVARGIIATSFDRVFEELHRDGAGRPAFVELIATKSK